MDSEVTRCARAVVACVNEDNFVAVGKGRQHMDAIRALRAALSAAPADGQTIGGAAATVRDAFTDCDINRRRILLRVIDAAVDLIGPGCTIGGVMLDPRTSISAPREKVYELQMAVHEYKEQVGLGDVAPRPAAPAENVDEARVCNAVSALRPFLANGANVIGLKETIRPYVTAPQPGTVEVPVETLREVSDAIANAPSNYMTAEVIRAITALMDLLPQPTPPSPSEADVAAWRAEAKRLAERYYADGDKIEGYENGYVAGRADMWLARAVAEWRGKNGGAT